MVSPSEVGEAHSTTRGPGIRSSIGTPAERRAQSESAVPSTHVPAHVGSGVWQSRAGSSGVPARVSVLQAATRPSGDCTATASARHTANVAGLDTARRGAARTTAAGTSGRARSGVRVAAVKRGDIKGMIDKGAKAIIFSPINSTGLGDAISYAKEKKVAMIPVDRNITGVKDCGSVGPQLGSDFVEQGRPEIRSDVEQLGKVAGTLDDNKAIVDGVLKRLPGKLNTITRTATYGSWFNFYLCDFEGRIILSNVTAFSPNYHSSAARCG